MTSRTWVAALGCGVLAIVGSVHPPAALMRAAEDERPTPRVVWRVAGEGRGTPAVFGSVAYFLSKRREVVAVDMATGRVRWHRSTGRDGTTMGVKVLATPLGVVAGDFEVVMFDRNGHERWRFVPRDGYGAGLYLGDAGTGLVFAGSASGKLYAIDEETGAERWSSSVADVDGTVVAPVVVGSYVFAGVRTRDSPSRGGVTAFEVETGRVVWSRWLPSSSAASTVAGLAGGPLVVGEEVVAAGGDGVVHLFDRRTGEDRGVLPSVGELQGALVPTSHDYRAMAASGRTLFVGSLSGAVVAYDLDTRRERWRRRPLGASVAFGLASDEVAAYVPYLSGHLVALDLASGAIRWQTTAATTGFDWVPASAGGFLLAASSTAGFFKLVR